MPLQSGTSTDMATISGEDAKSAIVFVKSPDSQQFEKLYDAHSEPYMTNTYPRDLGDINDIRLGDIAKDIARGLRGAVQDVYEAGRSVYETGKEKLQDVGVLPTPQPQPQPQPQSPVSVKSPKLTPAKPAVPEKHGEEGIKVIQRYFKTSSPLLQSFIGNDRYRGDIDGTVGSEMQRVIGKLEGVLANILGTNVVYGAVLRSSGPQDIESALQKITVFKNVKKTANITVRCSRDERIHLLSKILINNR